jgi:hypothetical protein
VRGGEDRSVDAAHPVKPPRDFPADGGDAYLAIAQGRLDRQLDDIDALDAKGGVVIGTALSEAAVVLALWALRPEQPPLHAWHWVLLALVALGLVVTLWWGGSGLRMREWRRYPDADGAWALRKEPHLAWELAVVLDEAFSVNVEPEKRKQSHVGRAAVSLGVLTIVVLAAAVALVWPG